MTERTQIEPPERKAPRLPRPKPHDLGSLLPWAIRAAGGDPLLVVVPFIEVSLLALLVVLVGAPGEPEVLVPLVTAPPVDAFQDVGVVDLVAGSTLATWALRIMFLGVRLHLFGTLVALAVQRVLGDATGVRAALGTVRRRRGTLAVLELLSFGAFGSVLVLRATLPQARLDESVGGALIFGVLFLPQAFIAAVLDELPAGKALRRSFSWVVRKPLGHLVLALGYVLALNGIYRLAVAGAAGRPPAIVTALYAFVAAFLTMLFLVAQARRYHLLYCNGEVARRATARSGEARSGSEAAGKAESR